MLPGFISNFLSSFLHYTRTPPALNSKGSMGVDLRNFLRVMVIYTTESRAYACMDGWGTLDGVSILSTAIDFLSLHVYDLVRMTLLEKFVTPCCRGLSRL